RAGAAAPRAISPRVRGHDAAREPRRAGAAAWRVAVGALACAISTAAEQVHARGVPRVRAVRRKFLAFVWIDRLADHAVAVLVRKLCQHSGLSPQEARALERLRPRLVEASRGTDLVRQGDKPDASIFLLRGMLGRYHTLAEGERQYLALHVA